ncbi:MAG: hypothetical protein K2G90_03050, partial [Muribaculaceae bacterium]|nr:hypothetical protein [Muribaculaceae bacterium]
PRETAPKPAEPAPKPAAPAPQPQQAAPAPPQRRPAKGAVRPTAFRLNEKPDKGNTPVNRLEQRSAPINPEGFAAAWNEFIVRNPSLHILVNAMRGAKPQPAENNVYRIVVDHPAQLQAFELSMPRLLEYLRDSLSNDLLTLRVEVAEAQPGNKHLPPKEFLRKVVEENPAMGNLLRVINGELI